MLPVVILARLQWSPTSLAYFSLSTCPGEPAHFLTLPFRPCSSPPHLRLPLVLADKNLVLCGDEEGNVWIYDVEHLLKQPPPLTTLQPPTQVLL